MNPFLRQVAAHYFAEGSMERRCFVFPNRRSLSFFRKYLAGEVKASGMPMVCPQLLTINDFFFRISGKKPADKIHLLLKLYDCYKSLNPTAEPLDDFIFWGDVLLSDFDDVDKYLVDPAHIFTNVKQFKGMQDDFSYLSDTQKDAMERFLGHFSNEGRIKTEFRKIWDILLPLYLSFRKGLNDEGLAYEGQVYRNIAERLKDTPAIDILKVSFPDTEGFVFCGLNALNECEKTLLRKTRNAGIAEFCWDYGGDMMTDSHNKSSFFLSEFVQEFKPAFELEEDVVNTRFRAISIPSATGQAGHLSSILSEIPNPGIETAIVLPDETMLVSVLNSIPEEIKELNVTMGYPLQNSAFWALMSDIAAMQMHIRNKDGQILFYHRQVRAIFSNSVFKALLDDDGKAITTAIREGAKYYIPMQDLNGHPLFDLIFRPAGEDITEIENYQQKVISGLARMIGPQGGLPLELDFAKDLYQAVGRLKTYKLDIKPATYYRLLAQMVSGISVPFHGEPLKGLQIMGPLETRALDFDNVIILNCNEGIFPRHNVSSSFIPPELRKAFGLPTYEFQDAVWAYYFYRLIRRASNVTMLFDSRPDVSRSGEESRYIKQLELHFGVGIERLTASSHISRGEEALSIPKKQEHIDILHQGHLSASALQNYLECPAKFYYSKVCGLKEEEEVSESLDAGMLGSIFHKMMEELYKERDSISATYLKALLADPESIRAKVRELILETLHCFEVSGRNIIYEDMVCRYVCQVLRRDLEHLSDRGVPSFRIFGLEQIVKENIGGFDFVGFVDRMDSFAPGELRIVDYKTGKVKDEDFLIDAGNAAKVVEALFGEKEDKPKIALQLYLYDRMARRLKTAGGRQIFNSIYQTSRLFVNKVENVELCPEFCAMMKDALDGLLAEIASLDKPWTIRKGGKKCDYCDFKRICGQ